MFTVRPFVPEDYPAAASIQNAQNEPHHQTTAEKMRERDACFAPATNLAADSTPARPFARLTAELDRDAGGEVVGTGYYVRRSDDDTPGRIWVGFHVRADYQNKGVDTAMFDDALVALKPHRPTSLWTTVRSDFVPTAGYLADRGFEEAFRSWGGDLDLETFDPTKFAALELRLRDENIHIRTFAELAGDAARGPKLLELHQSLEEDAPHFEPVIPKEHPDFRDPDTLLGSYVVAVHGGGHDGEYIGLASLHKTDEAAVLGCGLTGVSQPYRGRGVGTALEARAAAWAKAEGYGTLNTGGAGDNLPMLALNRRLGFDIEPAWVTFVKRV